MGRAPTGLSHRLRIKSDFEIVEYFALVSFPINIFVSDFFISEVRFVFLIELRLELGPKSSGEPRISPVALDSRKLSGAVETCWLIMFSC